MLGVFLFLFLGQKTAKSPKIDLFGLFSVFRPPKKWDLPPSWQISTGNSIKSDPIWGGQKGHFGTFLGRFLSILAKSAPTEFWFLQICSKSFPATLKVSTIYALKKYEKRCIFSIFTKNTPFFTKKRGKNSCFLPFLIND
jgi:hypothetical protein